MPSSVQGEEARANSEQQQGSMSRAQNAPPPEASAPQPAGASLLDELQLLKAVTAAPGAASLSKVPLQAQSSRAGSQNPETEDSKALNSQLLPCALNLFAPDRLSCRQNLRRHAFSLGALHCGRCQLVPLVPGFAIFV